MRQAEYIRIFSDPDGESHFEDVRVSLSPTIFAPPAPPLDVAAFVPATRTFWIGADAGWAGEILHPTPHRQIFVTVRGEYQVTASDGTERRFPAGRVLLLDDTSGTGHTTKIIGDEGSLVLAVQLSAERG